jgi:hypothetical protein
MTIETKYSLLEIKQIISNGFQYLIHPDVVASMNNLSNEILGEQICVKNPLFNSLCVHQTTTSATNSNNNRNNRKKRIQESSENDWKTVPFQATKLEQHVGIEANVDKLRLVLNKLTDKKFAENKNTIINELNCIYSTNISQEDNERVCSIIYTISSSNKFYSKIFADLYTELINMYEPIRNHFNRQIELNNILANYNNIKYIDPNVDYNQFCDNNKDNERRRSLSQFYVNLSLNNMISKDIIGLILVELLKNVMSKIVEPNNRELVDELTENVVILYNSDVFEDIDENDDQFLINEISISDTFDQLSKSKVKDFKSLTSKSIFKYMDLLNQ